jgi:hypothetical protein
VQCSAVQCSAVQCSAVQCSAVQCSAVQCSAVQCGADPPVFIIRRANLTRSARRHHTPHGLVSPELAFSPRFQGSGGAAASSLSLTALLDYGDQAGTAGSVSAFK